MHQDDDASDPEMERRLVSLMSNLDDGDRERFEPPPEIWTSIKGELGDAATTGGSVPVRLVPTDRRSSLVARSRVLLAAAAVVAVIAIASVVLSQRRDPSSTVVATAQLQQMEPLGSTSAVVRLVNEKGVKRLVIEATDMPPAPEGESFELWLIDAGVKDPRPVGFVSGSGEIDVPDSIDTQTHPVVDISLEPNDGDAGHSGHSLMRGTLT